MQCDGQKWHHLKAVVLSGPLKLKVEEIEIPRTKPDEVLVKVIASGICGSDVECYKGHSKEGRYDIAPYVPGHEWSGEVVEAGPEVAAFEKGDRVVGDCVVGCGRCYYCKSGMNPVFCTDMLEYGFMPTANGGDEEYLTVKEKALHKIPASLTWEEGALVEPFSVSYHGVWGVGGGVDASQDVAVFGAGPIGLFALVIAKVAGARAIVVENLQNRAAIAEKLGADAVIDPAREDPTKRILDLTNRQGVDLVVEATGSDEATAATVEVAKRNGRVVYIGHSIGRKIPVEIGKIIWKGLTVVGKAGSPCFFPRTIDFMSRVRNRIDLTSLITHKFPLEKAVEAFELATQRGKSVKILLLP
jgi:L-iditol 2-dehydrogenase